MELHVDVKVKTKNLKASLQLGRSNSQDITHSQFYIYLSIIYLCICILKNFPREPSESE